MDWRHREMAMIALITAAFLANVAEAQSSGRQSYVTLSRSIAAAFGRTWEMGRQCGVTLEGLSKASAQLLFSRRLLDEDQILALRAYDDAVEEASHEGCDRGVLDGEIRRTDAFLRRYLQIAAPIFPLQIGPRPTVPGF